MYDDEMRNNDTAENTTEQTTEQKEDNYYDTGSAYTHYDSSEAMNQKAPKEETGKKSRRLRKNRCKMPGAGTGIRKRFQRSFHGCELCRKQSPWRFCQYQGQPE